MKKILTYSGKDPIIVPPGSNILLASGTRLSAYKTDAVLPPEAALDLKLERFSDEELERAREQMKEAGGQLQYPKPSFGTINIDREMLRDALRATCLRNDMLVASALELELFGKE